MNNHVTQAKAGSVNSSIQSIEDFLNLSPSGLPTQTVSSLSYHELAEIPVREVNALEQLEKNIQTLADLRSRLQFLNREIRYLMKI